MEQPLNQNLPLTALTCLNGLKHGATSMTLFIQGEEPQDFYSLLAESFETHQPSNTADSALVTDAILARWYLWRRQRAFGKREFDLYSNSNQPDTIYSESLHEIALFDRYRIQAERTLARCLANVRNLKKDALNSDKWRAQLELQKSRFELDRQRFELRQAQDARIAEKIAAEAAYDAHQAKRNLTSSKELEAALPRLIPTPPSNPLVIENNESYLKQSIFVLERNNEIRIAPSPENPAIQALVDACHRCIIPPQKIVRDFYFKDCLIPDTYEWVFEGIDRSTALVRSDTINVPGLRVSLSFEQWQKLAAQEAPSSGAREKTG